MAGNCNDNQNAGSWVAYTIDPNVLIMSPCDRSSRDGRSSDNQLATVSSSSSTEANAGSDCDLARVVDGSSNMEQPLVTLSSGDHPNFTADISVTFHHPLRPPPLAIHESFSTEANTGSDCDLASVVEGSSYTEQPPVTLSSGDHRNFSSSPLATFQQPLTPTLQATRQSSSTEPNSGSDCDLAKDEESSYIEQRHVALSSGDHPNFSAAPSATFHQLLSSISLAMRPSTSTEANAGSACDLASVVDGSSYTEKPLVALSSRGHPNLFANPSATFHPSIRFTPRSIRKSSSTDTFAGSVTDLGSEDGSSYISPTPAALSSGHHQKFSASPSPFHSPLHPITRSQRRTSSTQANAGSTCILLRESGSLYMGQHPVTFSSDDYTHLSASPSPFHLPLCRTSSTKANIGSSCDLLSESGSSYTALQQVTPSSGDHRHLFSSLSTHFSPPACYSPGAIHRSSSTEANVGSVGDLDSEDGFLNLDHSCQDHQLLSPAPSDALFTRSRSRSPCRSTSTRFQRSNSSVPIYRFVETNFQMPRTFANEASSAPVLPSTSFDLGGSQEGRQSVETKVGSRQRKHVSILMEDFTLTNDPPYLRSTVSANCKHAHHVVFRMRMLSTVPANPHPKPDHIAYEDPLPNPPRHVCDGLRHYFVCPDRCSFCNFPDGENPAIAAVNVDAPSMISKDVSVNVSIEIYDFESSRGEIEHVLSTFVACEGHWVSIPEIRLSPTNSKYSSRQPVFLNVKYPPYRPSGLNAQKRPPVGVLEPVVMNNRLSYPTIIFLLVNDQQSSPFGVDTCVTPTTVPESTNTGGCSRYNPQFAPRHYNEEVPPGNHISVVTTYTLPGFDDVTLEYFITRQRPDQKTNPDIVIPVSCYNFSRGEQHTFTASPLGYLDDHAYGQIAPATVFTITEMNGAYLVIVYQEGPIHVELMFLTEVPGTNLLNNCQTP